MIYGTKNILGLDTFKGYLLFTNKFIYVFDNHNRRNMSLMSENTTLNSFMYICHHPRLFNVNAYLRYDCNTTRNIFL